MARYKGLAVRERKKLREAAEELGLCHKTSFDGSVTLYASGDELVYGVVPYDFEELGLHPDLVLSLLEWTPKPIEKATHIQATSIPKILAGEDIVIQAETGSGKTFAYLLPAAQAAIERANRPGGQREEEQEEDVEEDTEGSSFGPTIIAENPQAAVCYRVEPTAGPDGLRARQRPEEIAPNMPTLLRVGDEFMARSVVGSPLSCQFIEMADGRGWILWDRRDPRLRLSLSAVELKVGQPVEACEELAYGSGDVVARGAQGVIERVAPLVGVRWDGLDGVKAVDRPRRALRTPRPRRKKNKWAQCAPDTLIVTATRELCEQVADVARQLGRLLPEEVQDEWRVATAVGAPPGVGKRLKRGNEQWPFPKGDGAPSVIVTTLEFMGYFYHRKHVPLWANIRYIVYDEVDRFVAGPERRFLNRVKVMLLRAQRTEGTRVQSVLVASTMPSQGTKSTRMLVGQWMPHALRALPRPDLLHRNHPMIHQDWQYVPNGFDDKVKILVDYLKDIAKVVEVGQGKGRRKKKFYDLREKTMVFCNDGGTAVQLAEILATTYNLRKVGLFVSKIGYDERRERMKMLRDGRITLMVCTDILSRGIDIPDVEHVVQFDFSRNVVGHLHRIGRISRAGTCGRVLNLYDDSEQGGRALAEAVQDVGSQPLDGLFSRNRGFKKGLKRTEAFRQMLLTQGLPLPPHLQDGSEQEPPLLLSDVLSGTEAGSEQKSTLLLSEVLSGTEEISVGDKDAADAEDGAEAGGEDEEAMEVLFEKATDEEKDEEYVHMWEALQERREQHEDRPTEDEEEGDGEGGAEGTVDSEAIAAQEVNKQPE